MLVAGLALATLTGCPPQGPGTRIHDPLPMDQAIARINANCAQRTTALKAVGGHARGKLIDEDRRARHFDLDASLLVLPPRCLRLDLKALLESQLVFGSNPERYWVEQPGIRALTYGRHDSAVVPEADELVIRPDLFVEAMGLGAIPSTTSDGSSPIQRITENYQQLLFTEYDEDGKGYIAKEYWISRSDPQLLARIVFRDRDGETALDSQISQYRKTDGDGPLLPHRIELVSPTTSNWLVFTTWGWKAMPDVTEAHPAFVFPLDRGEAFDQITDLDVELDKLHNPFTDEELLRQLTAPQDD